LRKNLAYALALLSILLVLTASARSVAAADYTKVGVKVGDTATYRLSETSGTENKSTILVWGMIGSVVALNETDYTPAGAVNYKVTYYIDIYAGSLSLYWYLIASNLAKGDEVYHGSTGLYINDTTWMIVAGVNRTVNYISLMSGLWESWLDKGTGLMVKFNFWFLGWKNYTMISTTAFAPASPPSLFSNGWALIAIGEGVLILILIVLLALRGRKR
jgi:hypothetical protein